ncbi:MAG: hypothetical protein P9X26_06205 [Candidatus Stygibacter frigidus]|nr:hypothetical protein [Candidatus Stygibacter frigidus]
MLKFSKLPRDEIKRSREESSYCDIIGHYRHIGVTRLGYISYKQKLSNCDKQVT